MSIATLKRWDGDEPAPGWFLVFHNYTFDEAGEREFWYRPFEVRGPAEDGMILSDRKGPSGHYRGTTTFSQFEVVALLEDGACPEKTDTRAIPCPKVRRGVQTRWNGIDGKWEKLIKKGWVPV